LNWETWAMNKKIILADTFLESLNKLDKQSRKITLASLSKFAQEEKSNGFQLHNLDRIDCDSSFRTARVNKDLRLLISQDGNSYIILYIDHHDNSYSWAEGKFMKRSNFGALYVHDTRYEASQAEICEIMSMQDQFVQRKSSLLIQLGVSEKDLNKLGIPQIHSKLLMEFIDEDTFMNFISIFPEELQEALFDLVTGTKSITEVYAELQDQDIEENNLTTYEHKNSKRRFYTISDHGELENLMEFSTEKWSLFLHPDQEFLIRKNFNGPVLVEGGPGTGKTVVGIHRAVHLAKNVYPMAWGKNILFCTYSKRLAASIDEKISHLLSQWDLPNTIEVTGVDALFFNLSRHFKLTTSQIKPESISELIRDTYSSLDLDRPLFFYQTEYEEIIQKYQITTLEEYLNVSRNGQGERLHQSARVKIWAFFDLFLKRKKELSVIDFDDQAHNVFKAVQNGTIQPMFDSVIIDEAQDLSPIKFKAIQSLIKQTKNNMFILSDQNQRIFKLTSWRKEVKLDIVGRTYYLKLNYRTTKQIREYADRQFVSSKMQLQHIKEYKSLLLGSPPEVIGFRGKKDQYRFLTNKIIGLENMGIHPHEIGIISEDDLSGISRYLDEGGIEHTYLQKEVFPRPGLGIALTSMKGSKGLEFRITFIVNYKNSPVENNGLYSTNDYYEKQKLLQNECLKYVAVTRAREQLIVTYIE
jgi:mRNA-degrading endonuclease RelE of RelBE toxin-antitoxin system